MGSNVSAIVTSVGVTHTLPGQEDRGAAKSSINNGQQSFVSTLTSTRSTRCTTTPQLTTYPPLLLCGLMVVGGQLHKNLYKAYQYMCTFGALSLITFFFVHPHSVAIRSTVCDGPTDPYYPLPLLIAPRKINGLLRAKCGFVYLSQ